MGAREGMRERAALSTQLLPPGWGGCGCGHPQDCNHPLLSQFSSIPDADKLSHRCLLGHGALPHSCIGLFPSDQCILGCRHRWGMRFRNLPPFLALSQDPVPSPAKPSMHQTPGQVRPPQLSIWGNSWAIGHTPYFFLSPPHFQ